MQESSAKTSTSAAMLTPSHHTHHHHRNKKGSDPFLELSDEAVKLPDVSADFQGKSADGHSDSLLADLVLTPLSMISFIVSLSMVNRNQRQWRLSQHPSGSDSFWSRLTHWSWSDPEPYQDSRDGTWQHRNSTSTQNSSNNAFPGWYTKKKHRAMAKMEISDAFEMRKRVVFALLTWAALGAFAISYIARHLYGWLPRT